ncbi:MAG: hypothetical protein QM817_16570 [Archangium sp.]
MKRTTRVVIISSIMGGFWLDRGDSRVAFVTAFFFALLASGSVVCARLSEANTPFAVLASVAVTVGAVMLVVTGRSPRAPVIITAHVSGAIVALLAVHLAIALFLAGEPLIERPAQLMNDAVLVLTTLGFVWSFVTRHRVMRVVLPIASCALLGAYAASMVRWHLDPFPGLRVQHFVVGQVVSTSIALLVFFFVADDAEDSA